MQRKILTDPIGFGMALEELRKEKKLSRSNAASMSGCAPRTIARLEKGEVLDIGLRKALNILDSLGYGIQIVRKDGVLTLDELQSGARY